MKKMLCVFLCLTSFSAFAHNPNIVGTYKCTSEEPSMPNGLSSTMIIQKTGDVYSINENAADNHSVTSIGLVKKQILAVAYQNKVKERVGVEIFKIKDDGKKLKGSWAQLGTITKGSELCIKQK